MILNGEKPKKKCEKKEKRWNSVYKEKGKKSSWSVTSSFSQFKYKILIIWYLSRISYSIQFNSIHRRVILYWCQNLLNLIGGEWAEWCETEIKDENKNAEKNNSLQFDNANYVCI